MHLRLSFVLVVVALLCAMPTHAATKQEQRVAEATDVIGQFSRIPESSIPPALLSRAYAIAIVPNEINVGFGLGVRRGRGIVVVRRDDGTWSNPSFITMTGGSFGFQIGAQSSDVILVFKNRRALDMLTSSKLTLGADASVAAGPVGRHAAAATDWRFQSEVYSYSRSRGLFAGISLAGAGVTVDKKSNAAFYGSAITPQQIFDSSGNAAPDVANTFVQKLTAATRRLPSDPGMSAGTTQSAPSSSMAAPAQQQPTVRTYGIGDPDAPEDDGFYSADFD